MALSFLLAPLGAVFFDFRVFRRFPYSKILLDDLPVFSILILTEDELLARFSLLGVIFFIISVLAVHGVKANAVEELDPY